VADCVAPICQTAMQFERATNLEIRTFPAMVYTQCYAFALFLLSVFMSLFPVFSVRWLGSSFAFFCLALCVGKNANVLPKALAFSLLSF